MMIGALVCRRGLGSAPSTISGRLCEGGWKRSNDGEPREERCGGRAPWLRATGQGREGEARECRKWGAATMPLCRTTAERARLERPIGRARSSVGRSASLRRSVDAAPPSSLRAHPLTRDRSAPPHPSIREPPTSRSAHPLPNPNHTRHKRAEARVRAPDQTPLSPAHTNAMSLRQASLRGWASLRASMQQQAAAASQQQQRGFAAAADGTIEVEVSKRRAVRPSARSRLYARRTSITCRAPCGTATPERPSCRSPWRGALPPRAPPTTTTRRRARGTAAAPPTPPAPPPALAKPTGRPLQGAQDRAAPQRRHHHGRRAPRLLQAHVHDAPHGDRRGHGQS